jgi:flagellin-specific chaperone FliS
MKTNPLSKAILVISTAVFFAIASVSIAAQTSTDQMTTKEVKEKVGETAEAIKNYSVAQRDEALEKAKTVLDDLDARIDHMQSQLNEKWDQMDQYGRQKATDALTTLRKQRNEIAEWYGG